MNINSQDYRLYKLEMGKRKVVEKSRHDAEEFDESPSEESSNEDVRIGNLHLNKESMLIGS